MNENLAIVLGLETTARELDMRLLFSGLHARKGHRIFIPGGLSGQRLAADVPNALIVGKHLIHPTPQHPQAYIDAKRNGSLYIHLAEEGAVFMGEERDWQWDLDHQLDPRVIDPEDYICTWGDFQRDHYKQNAKNPDNVRTTGHPRFDILKRALRGFYEDEARDLRARYGDFVLWCSNFGMVNDPEGPFNTFSRTMGYIPEDAEARIRFIERWSYVSRTFSEFVEFFHKMSAKRPDMNFIIRPHPSDNVDFFHHAFRGVANVKVVHENTVAPWLLACRAMVHDGCTTGIEAHLLGTPIVNFRPLGESPQPYYLPNLFGHQCTAIESAIEAVETILTRSRVDETEEEEASGLPELAYRLLANLREDSFALFLNVVDEAEAKLRGRPRQPVNVKKLLAREANFIVQEGSKHLLRRAFSPKRYRTAMHSRHRFSGFSRSVIARKIAKVNQLTGNSLEFRLHGPNIIELTSSRREKS